MLKKVFMSIGIMLIGCSCFIACEKEEITFTGEEVAIVELEEDEVISKELGENDIAMIGNNVEVENQAEECDQVETDGDSEMLDPKSVIVHICGAVKQPGVYELPKGSRIYDGVMMAGGFMEEASLDYINQAMELLDGVQVIIPTKEEVDELEASVSESGMIMSENSFGVVVDSAENAVASDGLVNINTADESKLCTITGVGESRAKSIIAYREEVGSFQQISDIMKVVGIKEGSFEAMKDEITVN